MSATSSGGGFFLSVAGAAAVRAGAGEALCSAVGFAASVVALDFFAGGFANKVPAASKPVIRRQIGLNIGKGTSKQFRCPLEVGSAKSEVGSRKCEVGSGKWEVGSGKSEGGSRKAERNGRINGSRSNLPPLVEFFGDARWNPDFHLPTSHFRLRLARWHFSCIF
jgi:hypothetical protein